MKMLVAGTAALAGVVMLTGFALIDYSKSFDRYQQLETDQVDAIVVLTGGVGRLSRALQLFSEIQAEFLLISGVEEAASLESIFPAEALSAIDNDRIVLEKTSQSTHENALYAREIMVQRQVHKILLVTSNYHLRRALFIFQQVFPGNIEIVPYAVESDTFHLKGWWRHPRSLRLAVQECLKFWWYRIAL